MADAGVIKGGIDVIADFILRYAITLAAVGALTVGLLEAWKKLFNTLSRFQRQAVERWLTQEAMVAPSKAQIVSSLHAGGHYGVQDKAKAGAGKRGPYEAKEAYRELLHLTTGVPVEVDIMAPAGLSGTTRNVSYALFELDLAKMMAQIQEAADAALNNPQRYANWFAFVTRGCTKEDVDLWLLGSRTRTAPPPQQPTREELGDVYARIRLLMRRQLDSFQTITSFRWKEWNQFWAWAVGAVLLLVAQLLQAPEGAHGVDYLFMVVVALAGGILAPVAKDLVDALAKVKSGG